MKLLNRLKFILHLKAKKKKNKISAVCALKVENLHNPVKFEIYYIKPLSQLKYIWKARNLFKTSGYFRWIIYFTFSWGYEKTDDDLLQMSSPIQLQRLFYWSSINNRYTPHTWIYIYICIFFFSWKE